MKKGILNAIKIIVTSLCAFGVIIGLTYSSLTKEATSVYGYDYFIDETNYSNYDYVVGTGDKVTTFKLVFYKTYLSSSTEAERRNEQNVQGVAVRWLGIEGYTEVDTISIDSSVTLNNTNYSVIAVAKDGFARAPFKTITIPNSVKEIREGAFAHCLNLTSFTFPCMNKIFASTFLDCRKLAQLRFRDTNGNESMQNDTITEIDDHAFDSCIALTNFRCPIKVTRFGRSCFQNCRAITSFYFPTTRYVDNKMQEITVEESAFADCTKLSTVYFEENVTSIARYAFVHCAPGLIFLCPDGTSCLGSEAVDDLWRRKYLGAGVMEDKPSGGNINANSAAKDYYTIDTTANKIFRDDNYPGLTWSIVNANIMMDNSLNTQTLQSNPGKYAIITEFIPPFSFQTASGKYYYHINDDNCNGVKDSNESNFTGANFKFVVPNTLPDIKGNKDQNGNYTDFYTVKVIDTNAFANLDCQQYLKKVVFNSGLVQIRHEAFLDCTKIAELDFDSSTSLLEIGYNVFHQPKTSENSETYNIYVDSLKLPQSLKYIGEFAFYNFLALSKEISFGTTPSLNVIGAYAFAVAPTRFGTTNKYRYNEGTIDLVLPNTLSDTEGKKYKRISTSNPKSINYYSNRGYAIGTHAFDNAINIKTVEMKDGGSDLASFASYAFRNCVNLLNFRASDKTCLLGQGMFENCSSLKEVFLIKQSSYVNTGTNEAVSYPWGVKDSDKSTYGGTLFSGDNYSQDVVIYVDGTSAGGSSNNVSNAYRWNVQSASAFVNELQSSNSNRSMIPTYYQVDWKKIGESWTLDYQYEIAYWKPSDNSFLFNTTGQIPTTNTQYNGIISILRDSKKTAHNVIVARYYSEGVRTLRRYVSVSGNLQWIDVKPFDGSIAYSKADKTCVTCEGKIYTIKYDLPAPKIGKNAFSTSYWTSVKDVSEVTTNYSSGSSYSENDFAWFNTDVSTTNTIDLTRIPTNNPFGNSVDISGKMTKIGDEAFAIDSNNNSLRNLGYYFILPTGITTIGERAFYRKGKNENGVRIVTYKDSSGNYHKPSGNLSPSTDSLSDVNAALEAEFNANGGYLLLASNNKDMTINRNAFYNNRFSSINLGDKLKFLGNGAFYTHDAKSDIETVTISSSNFELYKNGIYYKVSSNKVLVYQAEGMDLLPCTATLSSDTLVNNSKTYYTKSENPIANLVGKGGYLVDVNGYSYTSVASPTGNPSESDYYEVSNPGCDYLSIQSGTVAIGMRAFANSGYTYVELPSTLTTILGGAFQKSSVTNIVGDGLSSLQYICADESFYNDGTMKNYFDIYDSGNAYIQSDKALRGAFRDCAGLTEINFKQMESLQKIGKYAFYNCSALDNMAGEDRYVFRSNSGDPVVRTKKVLDLSFDKHDGKPLNLDSNYNHITSIDQYAFDGCSQLEYVILPQTASVTSTTVDDETTVTYSESKLTLGGATVFPSVTILVGETVNQAKSNEVEASVKEITKPGNHYPASALNDYANSYFRTFTIDDCVSKETNSKYWTYIDGSMIVKGGYAYTCTVTTAANEEWDATHWNKITDSAIAAYDPSDGAYEKGDIVEYNNHYYICNSDTTVMGAWDDDKWESVNEYSSSNAYTQGEYRLFNSYSQVQVYYNSL